MILLLMGKDNTFFLFNDRSTRVSLTKKPKKPKKLTRQTFFLLERLLLAYLWPY